VEKRLSDLLTPCLVLDRDIMQANIRRMADRADALGVELRPHLKTCKSVEIARMIKPGRAGITVSTLQEAEYFARAGFRDIMYAVSIVPRKMPAIAALNRDGAGVQVILDHPSAARAVADQADALEARFDVWIEVDVDGHRAGLEPGDPLIVETGRAIRESSLLNLAGVMTHAGESYTCRSASELEAHAGLERRRCVRAADRLRENGIKCPKVSVGSTPTALSAVSLEGVSELRAGVYVFFDLFQAGLGVCRMDDIALSVLTTVVSHKTSHRRLIVDAGGLALSKDRGTAEQAVDCGYGLVADAISGRLIPGLRVSSANQEHGIIELPPGFDFQQFPLGSQLRILPNHACMTAAAHEHYFVVAGDDRVTDRWERCNGW
jgi:D-serine deaminase-like pyridoxal phosphate-dependent protein